MPYYSLEDQFLYFSGESHRGRLAGCVLDVPGGDIPDSLCISAAVSCFGQCKIAVARVALVLFFFRI